MLRSNIFKLFLLCTIAFSFANCSQSEAQRDFEEQALLPPAGITEMTANGTSVQGGENDTDDWRTAPNFSGTVSIATAAFPNPVAFNSSFEVLVEVQSFQAVNGLQVFAFQQAGQNQLIGPLFQESGVLDVGFTTIRLSPQQFASSTGTGNFGNLYRIIFYDGRGTVVSYGDVQVQ